MLRCEKEFWPKYFVVEDPEDDGICTALIYIGNHFKKKCRYRAKYIIDGMPLCKIHMKSLRNIRAIFDIPIEMKEIKK